MPGKAVSPLRYAGAAVPWDELEVPSKRGTPAAGNTPAADHRQASDVTPARPTVDGGTRRLENARAQKEIARLHVTVQHRATFTSL